MRDDALLERTDAEGDLVGNVGNRWQFAPWEPFRAGSSEVLGWAGLLRGEMVGRSILYRWVAGPGASTSNRWFVGKIVDALLDSTDVEEGMGLGRRAKNFKVDYGDVCLGQSLAHWAAPPKRQGQVNDAMLAFVIPPLPWRRYFVPLGPALAGATRLALLA